MGVAMKRLIIVLLCSVIYMMQYVFAQDWKCGNVDTVSSIVQQSVAQTVPLVIVFVDFPDGRKQPYNVIPTQDSDTAFIQNINATGGMGWVPSDPEEPNSPLRKKIRKYEYEHYWNMFFSIGTYQDVDSIHPHPDWNPHRIKVYGSLKDYYKEATYDNIILEADCTHPGPINMYNTGIINHIDSVNGKKYIRWIMWPFNKEEEGNGVFVTIELLDEWKSQGLIDFNTTGFRERGGKIITVNAGHNLGGINIGYTSAVREKRLHNDNNQSTLDGIWVSAHELGHSFGAQHTETGWYDVMNYSTRAGWITPLYCPQHFNPWFKIQKGWIPSSNIRIIGNNNTMSLPPITDSAVVSIVKVYGDAGRDDNYFHSEYFLIEYRKRNGFNRFAGGYNVPPNYTGGALVWNFSSFGYGGMGNIKPKFGPAPLNDPAGRTGTPEDLFPTNTALDSCDNCQPNSHSFNNVKTGILLNNFSIQNNRLTFHVNYQLGAPPNYNVFLYFSPSNPPINPPVWSGRVYIEDGAYAKQIESGTIIDCLSGSIDLEEQAIGGSPSSIIFRGAGYANHRMTWTGISLRTHNRNVVPKLINCRVENAFLGAYLSADGDENGVYPTPMVRSSSFIDCIIGMKISGRPSGIQYAIDVSGLDSNTFSKIIFRGNLKLQDGNFTLASNRTLTLESPSIVPLTTRFLIRNNRIFTIEGTLEIQDTAVIEGSTWRFMTDLNIPESKKLRINPNTRLEFANGKGISILGRLNSTGSNEDPIYFTSQQSGQWRGIDIKSGLSNLSHCDIQNAATGITINNCAPIINYSNIKNCGTGISITTGKKYSPLISNNKISDCSIGIDITSYINIAGYPRINSNAIHNTQTGIYIRNTDKAEIRNNKIYNSDIGVYVFQSSPVFYRNVIESNYKYGVFSDESNPRFGDYLCDDPGNNIIRFNEGYDLYVMGGIPFLGLFGKQCIIGGYNSLYLQEGVKKPIVFADKGSHVLAQVNWWGEYPPKEELFYASDDSRIDIEYPLDYDPNRYAGNDPVASIQLDAEESILQLAIEYRAEQDYTNAITTYSKFIKEKPNSSRIKRAIQSLRNTYRDFSIWESDTTKRAQLINYLNFIAINHPKPSIRKIANLLLADEQYLTGNTDNAVTRYRQIIQNEPNSERERTSLYSLFNIFHHIGDKGAAQNVLMTIISKYPNAEHTKISQIRYELMREGTNNQYLKSYQAYDNESYEIPNQFILYQNYPNPFNPLTFINYQLPPPDGRAGIDNWVTLKVYDVLGREVAKLVDDYKSAGYYDVSWDASNMPSGVYIYKLSAGGFTEVKKMLLLR